MNILICGGGTGGHITPALALYDEFMRRGIDTRLVVAVRDIPMLPEQVKRETLALRSRGGFGRVRYMFELFFALLKSIGLILRYRPSAVIGMGGYISTPPLIAALLMRVPLYICEQNSIPGKANRFLARFAADFFHSFARSQQYIAKGSVTGNPVRRDFFEYTRERARKELSLPANDPVLLVMGGSQGAKRLNEIFLDAYPDIVKRVPKLAVFWVCGAAHHGIISGEISSRKLTGITLLSFYKEMHRLVHAADFAVARSGSSSLNEFRAAKLPALFVPFPFATDDHQFYNAEEAAAGGGAFVVREELLDKIKLADIISNVLTDASLRANMRRMTASGLHNAASVIADAVTRRP
ncbi:MAG: UDP-N-acetylglucosamine--N-acetylmuramyl-(pentapeptide) pyrophosphoryl-undecaprenol N-acetylglucosamine transferase [Spirochaetes bacterium]|nr:UDP-N-acetylglucosamine--N-acetylmuramyl-(pentapeptide) pyrophosphoryl-undecaprenol N-acetylglucosamine transferase [Spirochaetota bacterium]